MPLEKSVLHTEESVISYDGSIVVPASVEYEGMTYTVMAVGDYAFWQADEVHNVTLPNTVVSLGENSFSYNNGLQFVFLPESLKEIGEKCFSHSTGIKSITFPSSLEKIGEKAFVETGLKTVMFNSERCPEMDDAGLFEGDEDIMIVVPSAYREEYADALGDSIGQRRVISTHIDEYDDWKMMFSPVKYGEDNELLLRSGVITKGDAVAFVEKDSDCTVLSPFLLGAGYIFKINGESADPELVDFDPEFVHFDDLLSLLGEANIEFCMSFLLDFSGESEDAKIDLTFFSSVENIYDEASMKGGISYMSEKISAPGSMIVVTDLSGKIVARGMDEVSLAGLQSGIYLASSKGLKETQSIKVLVK